MEIEPTFIDVGNSYWKAAHRSNHAWMVLAKGAGLDSLETWLDQQIEAEINNQAVKLNQPAIEWIFANVGPSEPLQALIKRKIGCVSGLSISAELIETGPFPGFFHSYEQPSHFGVDRWLTLLALLDLKQPIGVLDFGTASTFDMMDARGQHLGGWIAPGYGLLIKSLTEQSERLQTQSKVVDQENEAFQNRVFDMQNLKSNLGQNTLEAIKLGTQNMLLGFYQQAIEVFLQTTQDEKTPLSEPLLVVTGGGLLQANLLTKIQELAKLKQASLGFEHEPFLVFKGMERWWLNHKQQSDSTNET